MRVKFVVSAMMVVQIVDHVSESLGFLLRLEVEGRVVGSVRMDILMSSFKES